MKPFPKQFKNLTQKKAQLVCTGTSGREHGVVVREEWSRTVRPGRPDLEQPMRSVPPRFSPAHGTNPGWARGCMKCGTPDRLLTEQENRAVHRLLEMHEPGTPPLQWDLDKGRLVP